VEEGSVNRLAESDRPEEDIRGMVYESASPVMAGCRGSCRPMWDRRPRRSPLSPLPRERHSRNRLAGFQSLVIPAPDLSGLAGIHQGFLVKTGFLPSQE